MLTFEETADPAGRRGVHHDRVVHVAVVAPVHPPPGRLGRLAGDQHVGQARGDGGGEIHHAEPGQRLPGAAQVIEHLQVVEQRAFRVHGQRVHVAALPGALLAQADRHLAFLVRKRRAVEEPGDALPALDLDQQNLAAGAGQGQRHGRRHRGLAGAALAGDHVQPHAVPVGIPRGHALAASGCSSNGGYLRADTLWFAWRGWHVIGLSLRWGLGREVIPVGAVVAVIVILVILGIITAARSFKVVQQYEKGIIYRFGQVLPEIRGPGLHLIRPVGDRMAKVNMQIVAMAVPAQEGITRDNVTVRVDAVVYFRVVDPIKATVNVQNYMFAISQQAQTSLRSIIGQSEMDQLLAERETVNRELRRIIDEPTEGPWGIRVERVELKDVSLPEQMKRSMSRQAEAERERRARIITADGEYQASKRLAAAANVMARDPAALQLRLLQTVVEVAGEKNSTLVMPVPVELLRFFEKMAPGPAAPAAEPPRELEDYGDAEVAAAEAAISNVKVPELEESSIPPVPEVESPVAPGVREVTAPDLAAKDKA